MAANTNEGLQDNYSEKIEGQPNALKFPAMAGSNEGLHIWINKTVLLSLTPYKSGKFLLGKIKTLNFFSSIRNFSFLYHVNKTVNKISI